MSYAILYDTGYGSAAMDGTQTAKANRAGVNFALTTISGIELNIQTESLNGGGSLQSDTELRNEDKLSSTSPVTFDNPTVLLNCSLPVNLIDDTAYQYSWLYQLIKMERTKGVKVIALKSGASGDYVYNRLPTVPEMYGKRYLTEPSARVVANLTGQTYQTIPHLVGYVKNVSNIVFSAKDNLLRFSITFRLIEDLE